ncbi:MAG TPA: hypothetical protein VL995_12860 [Cellvibrio sp.]|nr:hypothetical protein [Cellvibrio sp.]
MSTVQKRVAIFLTLLLATALLTSAITERSMVSFCEEHDGVSEIFVLTTREARIYWHKKQELNHENN